MNAVTHLEKVIVGEVSAVTHLEKVIAGETSAVTYTEKVITGEATPITHLQKVIAGEASPVTHLEYVWAGGSPPSVQEYTGAVPVTFVADGTPLIDYIISGNTVQSSTPTPDNPVMPQGTGDKTANLFDITSWIIANGSTYTKSGNSYTFDTRQSMYSTPYYFSEADIAISISGILENVSSVNARIDLLHADGTVSSGNVITDSQAKSENIYAAGLRFNWSTGGTVTLSNIMLNLGSTALPYEPFGVKIPISSASTTTPVYLGEVETTRKIKKLVLTGEENFSYDATYTRFTLIIPNARFTANRSDETPCTHYVSIHDGRSIDNVPDDSIYVTAGSGYVYINIKDTTYTSLADFKSYLAAQYAAGTPVCVWYVLATPQTAVVNEPLRKIGDYADTLSMEQVGVSIPTNNGSTTVDVDTTLKPSEVYIKYKGV